MTDPDNPNLSAPSGSCDEGVRRGGSVTYRALSTSSSTLTPDADRTARLDPIEDGRFRMTVREGEQITDIYEGPLIFIIRTALRFGLALHLPATPAIRDQAFEEALGGWGSLDDFVEMLAGLGPLLAGHGFPNAGEEVSRAANIIRALKGTPPCAHCFVEHPCPSPEQEDKRYCELCGEPEPTPSPDLLKELVEALKWALPLALSAVEAHRLERVRCGHTDIKGTYKSGETWVGIYQTEVDDIERARAVLLKAQQPGANHD